MKNLEKNFLQIMFDRYFSFFKGKYVNKIKNLELAIKVLLLFCISLMFSFLLAVYYVMTSSNDKIIHVEINKDTIKKGETYKVSKDHANEPYIESVGRAILIEATNYSYQTMEDKSNFILNQVHPDDYEKVYSTLKKETEFVVQNRVKQVFKIKDWKVEDQTKNIKRVVANGLLTRTVGGVEIVNNKHYKADVSIKMEGGIPFVSNIQLLYTDKKRQEREKRKKLIENYDIPEYKKGK